MRGSAGWGLRGVQGEGERRVGVHTGWGEGERRVGVEGSAG